VLGFKLCLCAVIDLASCGSVGGAGGCGGFMYRGRQVRSYERAPLLRPPAPYTRLSPGSATITSLPDPVTATTTTCWKYHGTRAQNGL